jgi:hypothetical protein
MIEKILDGRRRHAFFAEQVQQDRRGLRDPIDQSDGRGDCLNGDSGLPSRRRELLDLPQRIASSNYRKPDSRRARPAIQKDDRQKKRPCSQVLSR